MKTGSRNDGGDQPANPHGQGWVAQAAACSVRRPAGRNGDNGHRYNTSVGIYRCPADRARVRTTDGVEAAIPRTRSYSMSQSINGAPIESKYYTYAPSFQKESDIDHPSPAELFSFMEVHEERRDSSWQETR
ncbi:MAG TPA: hypothetical protein VMS21_12925 [Methylomirabilota bacterium]|nr:hypothetical protein [Methylomirabilota bacterium]